LLKINDSTLFNPLKAPSPILEILFENKSKVKILPQSLKVPVAIEGILLYAISYISNFVKPENAVD
jgi:hypothetical protein